MPLGEPDVFSLCCYCIGVFITVDLTEVFRNPGYHLSGELESQLFKKQRLHVPLDFLLSFCSASNSCEKKSFVTFLDPPQKAAFTLFPKLQRLKADRGSAADFKATFPFTELGTMTCV